MEAYSSSSSSSSSLQEVRGLKLVSLQPFHASLHSVRKPLAKPWKKPIAPLPPPSPLNVYTVDPVNFRTLVQKLTAAPEFMSQSHQTSPSSSSPPLPSKLQLPHKRLQRMAPSPLNIVAAAVASPLLSEAEVSAPLHLVSESDNSTKSQNDKFLDNALIITSNSLGLNLSPSSYNWCAFPILSPGTLSSLEPSTVP